MNPNILKGVGLIGKAVWEVTENQFSQGVTDFFAALGLIGVHTSIVSAMQAKGMQPPTVQPTKEEDKK